MAQPVVETKIEEPKTEEATGSAAEGATDTETPSADEVAKWKALSRKHEAEAKANAEKAKAFDAAEEAAKTEQQKLADRAAAAEEKALKAERKAFAIGKGIPESMLTGSTEAEWEAAAAAALAWKGTSREEAKPPAAPSAKGQGKVGDVISSKAGQLSRADLKNMAPEAIEKARKEGLLDDLLKGTTT